MNVTKRLLRLVEAAESKKEKKPTQKETIAQIRALGMSVRYVSDTGEYRVNFKNGSEDTAYYTDCPIDALGTAKAMKKEGLKEKKD